MQHQGQFQGVADSPRVRNIKLVDRDPPKERSQVVLWGCNPKTEKSSSQKRPPFQESAQAKSSQKPFSLEFFKWQRPLVAYGAPWTQWGDSLRRPCPISPGAPSTRTPESGPRAEVMGILSQIRTRNWEPGQTTRLAASNRVPLALGAMCGSHPRGAFHLKVSKQMGMGRHG